MQMAADQRKKRLNPSNVVCYSSREQYKEKKKKLKITNIDLKTRPNISLEWDDKKKSVVAKKEQIGIAQRDSIQYIEAFPHCQNILTDVYTVPREIFELKNITEVLSYEVWQTHLSEKERELLTQFLPRGVDADEIVQELLSGDNFHFGNPLLKWGSSLCSGNFHPDAVLNQELCFKANKKAYYTELQKYHNDMIRNLQTWKEKWASCKDPEQEIVEKIWRSRKHAEKSMPTAANEYRFRDFDENTSESSSWAADEKLCSSDNLNLMTTHGESQRRKDFMDGKFDNSSDGLKVVSRHRKAEKLHKRNIHCGDGAKYMSYIKVSKEQHHRVKSSMKHSSNSIQPRSLNHVLGNLDTFDVQPYEVFEEEERQKLHKHWLLVANRDLPSGFANWKRRQLEKRQLIKSLGQEMEGKMKYLNEDEKEENPHNMLLPEQTNNGASDLEATSTMEGEEGEDKEMSDSLLQAQSDDGETSNDSAIAIENEEKKLPDYIHHDPMDNVVANYELTIGHENESAPASPQHQNPDNVAADYALTIGDENEIAPASPQHHQDPQQITLCSTSHEFGPMELDSSHNHIIPKTNVFPPNVSDYPEILTHVDHRPSTSDVWPPVSMASAYYNPTSLTHEFTSVGELSLAHSEDVTKNLLLRQSNNEPFFSPYPNQGRHELLQSFFKDQEGISGVSPYHHEQKGVALDFEPATSVTMEMGQFTPFELRQKRLNDLYIHQSVQENMYSDISRYSVPRQEHLPSLHMQDWAVNTATEPHLNGGMLSQNWFSGSGGDVGPHQSVIGSGNNASDQNLFSVLSQCNELRGGVGPPYDSVGSTQRFVQSGGIDGGISTTNYLIGGHEAAATAAGLKTNNLGWVSLPHQNTALQDSLSKPFLRSWDR